MAISASAQNTLARALGDQAAAKEICDAIDRGAGVGYLQLQSTDTDGDAEGQIWLDASEDKLKFHNGTAVKTVTSS